MSIALLGLQGPAPHAGSGFTRALTLSMGFAPAYSNRANCLRALVPCIQDDMAERDLSTLGARERAPSAAPSAAVFYAIFLGMNTVRSVAICVRASATRIPMEPPNRCHAATAFISRPLLLASSAVSPSLACSGEIGRDRARLGEVGRD